MAIKDEKEFPLCKNCDFVDVDFEYRKNSIKCCNCQLAYYFNELEKEIFESNFIIKIMFPIVNKLNKMRTFIDRHLRRNHGNKKL